MLVRVDGTDELLTIAEVSVGLAGFAGVVAVFQQKTDFTTTDRIRFVAIFAGSLGALFLSFVPLALARSEWAGAGIWRWSSLIMLVIWSAGVSVVPWGLRRIGSEMPISKLALALLLVPTLANGVLQLLNVTGWWWEPGPVAYIVGLLVWLYAAAMMFVYSVLLRPIYPREED